MLERIPIPKEYRGMVMLLDYGAEPPAMRSSHHHDEIEINLFVSGTASYLINGQFYRVAPGSVIIFPAGLNHQLVDISLNFSIIVVVFRRGYLPEVGFKQEERESLLSARSKSPWLKHVDKQAYASLVDTIKHIYPHEHEELKPAEILRFAGQVFGYKKNRVYEHPNPTLLNSGLDFFFNMLWAHYHASEKDLTGVRLHPSVEKACDLLNKGQIDMSLEEIANIVGLSASRLSRLFKQQMGMAITRYKNQLKLDTFLRLYSENRNAKSNITNLAFESGFGSYAQFYKVFKEHYGEPPSMLRD